MCFVWVGIIALAFDSWYGILSKNKRMLRNKTLGGVGITDLGLGRTRKLENGFTNINARSDKLLRWWLASGRWQEE